MYDAIFDDFNTIKRHFKRNGGITFEESVVFELLENYYPQYGSVQAVQLIIEMFDAQWIRDCKNFTKEQTQLEAYNSDKSNDEGSIVEVEIQPKMHPFIDLTENSHESDDNIIVEKCANETFHSNIHNDFESDDGAALSENDYNGLSDSDIKNVEDEYNISKESRILEDYLAILEEPNSSDTSHQNNFNIIEVPEMLEENNNDPNNNLDDGIFNEESANNNSNIVNDSNFENLNSDAFANEIIEPIPGCSKDTDEKINIRTNNKGLPSTSFRSTSPVPGCSKYLDNINDFQPSTQCDESIQNDALCIQKIVPWANLETIYSILNKHNNSSNRKQLTLWDLMSEGLNHNASGSNKRKLGNDICMIPKKNLKTETNDCMNESSMDLIPNLQGNVCNESSNDSQSSKILESNELNIGNTEKVINNQSLSLKFLNNSVFGEESNLTVANTKLEKPSSDSFLNPSVPKGIANSCQLMIDHPVKKEKTETIVSGSLNQCFPNPEIKPGNISLTANFNNSLREQSVNSPHLSNRNNILPIGNNVSNTRFLSSESYHVNKIKEDIELTANLFLIDNSIKTGVCQDIGPAIMNKKSDNVSVIKPAKLVYNDARACTLFPAKLVTTTASYIRPATLKYSNKNSETNLSQKDNPINILRATATRQNILTASLLPTITQKNPPKLIAVPNIKLKNPASFVTHKGKELSMAARIKVESMNISMPASTQPKLLNTPLLVPTQMKLNNRMKTLDELVNEYNKSTALPSSSVNLISNTYAEPSSSGMNSGSLNSAFDPTIYSRLRAMFPDVKASFVKEICTNPPNVINYNDKDILFNTLIDHLLNEGYNHLEIVENNIEEQTATALSVNEKYEYLLAIFPDVDPTYLRDFIEKSCHSDQALEQFIQQKLETHDYPTKEQYLAKIKITEQQKQYTTDFKVEKFLELFPDPLKHFENEKRQCLYHPIAMEFLKSSFNKNKVSTISRQYTVNKYNLSLTAKALSYMGFDMKSKRMSSEMPTEDIPLLQEIAFIKNKQNILNHINTLKTQEEQLFKDLREKNLLVTCQCCYDDECMPTKCSECNEGHVICYECIIRGTESALADGEAHVKCFTDCNSEFSLANLQKVLPPTKFSALLKKRQAAEVMAAEVDGLVSCPFCHFSSIPPPEDKVFKCLNTECMKETCRQCKELNHVPLRCDEVIKTDKARRLIEEKMTEALLRTCYNCKRQFYKEEGCNKMTCKCGALMCYVCDKPVKTYSHFNPQGGANVHLCPLWSDDRRMNAEAVRKVAEDVTKAILKNNPNLKIDTESLLPKLPPKSKGPHDDIPNSNQLPEHVRRLAGAAP